MKTDLALNNLQRLICHKTEPTNHLFQATLSFIKMHNRNECFEYKRSKNILDNKDFINNQKLKPCFKIHQDSNRIKIISNLKQIKSKLNKNSLYID